jgi:phage shock protein PspC (stress-responsive transcriptional regulator)
MIRHQLIFEALLITSCTYALLRGRSEERIVALVCVCATIASRFAVSPLSVRYRSVETGLLAIDLLVLAAFILVALRSRRFWPLWVAGLQLTSSAAHLMKAIDEHLLPIAYGTALAMWSYPILIILAVATWRVRRPLEESGPVTLA